MCHCYKIFLLVLFSILSIINTYSQPQYSEWMHFYKYNVVNTIATQNDTMWIGTEFGLFKFLNNGQILEHYNQFNSPLKAINILDVKVDSEGTKWIGTDGAGLFRLSGNNWQSYDPFNSSLQTNRIGSIAIQSPDTIWIGGRGGDAVSRLVNGVWENYNQSNTPQLRHAVRQVTVDKQGRLYVFIDSPRDFLRFDGSQWLSINLYERGGSNEINYIGSDLLGNVWIGTNHGLMKASDADRWTVFIPSNSGLPSSQILELFSQGNRLWIRTPEGLSSMDVSQANSRPSFVQNLSSLGINEHIYSFGIDDSDKAWIGLFDKIVRQSADSPQIINTSNDKNIPDQIQTVFQDREGRLWFGSSVEGIGVLNAHNWMYFNTSNTSFSTNWIECFAEDKDGNIWVGTQNGAYTYNGQNWSLIPQTFGLGIYTIQFNSDHTPWLGTTEGLMTKKDGNWIRYQRDIHPGEYFGLTATGLTFDGSDTIWITHHDGISRLILPDSWTNWTKPQLGIDAGFTDIIRKEPGVVWIGMTPGGVLEFDGIVKTIYNTENSELAAKDVWAIKKDKNSIIWAATNEGYSYYKNGEWKNFNADNTPLIKAGYSQGNQPKSISEIQNLWPDTENNIWMVQNGPRSIFKLKTTNLTDISEPTKRENFHVFPNPTSGTLNVMVDSKIIGGYLEIIDITGRQVFSSYITNTILNLDLPNLHTGIYFVTIRNDSYIEAKKIFVR